MMLQMVLFHSRKIYFNLEAFLMVCIKCEWWTPLNPTPFQGKTNKLLPTGGKLKLAAQETGGEHAECEEGNWGRTVEA